MRLFMTFLLVVYTSIAAANEVEKLPKLQLKPLTQKEKSIIIYKGTERPFSGKYYNFDQNGTYYCKQCGAKLFDSTDKFHSGCGWPSFDDAIEGAVKKVKDADGRRVEILCARCGAHLGHVFEGEGFTEKNRRYCVNSISLDFQKATQSTIKKVYFAGGCFWGVEYYLEKQKGVLSVVSGYMGGEKPNPSYRDVSRGDSGYLEIVEVTYDSTQVDYETLARLFFEIHDPTQKDGQGPDIGKQYRSAIFVSNKKERKIVQKLINLLELKGYDVATTIRDKKEFYEAEKYHQDYYDRKGKKPYCHGYVKRF
ncbi:bifunctional methionine sulfoxide reductase B/A protein [Sulfurimonas marina]|uniref:Peptide methionine sulfoxide reductase MsrA n=1 Tax=Sulfurimonas marina TaxID=2590551 RepID=A0A7M1ATV3_9BACT|nr:bifunctional methionine sulfoxide reductase B/A protein [Sulfurimonas marina]QOP40847.1 bifunctional methionine sulfoxide reductase B/A protein [Sulfurimonas marina]